MHVGDIDVMIDVYIYIYCLLQWNVKKIAILGVFAECHGQGTRQRFFKKKYIISLPSASPWHSAKYFFLKKIQKFFAECLGKGTRQSNFLKKIKTNFAECLGRGTRQSTLKKTLPSAWAGTRQSNLKKKLSSAVAGTRQNNC